MDSTTRSLLQEIFKLEPNLRITIAEIKQHKFFASTVWDKVKNKSVEVPYAPEVGKFQHLLASELSIKKEETEKPVKRQSVLESLNLQRINKEFEDF